MRYGFPSVSSGQLHFLDGLPNGPHDRAASTSLSRTDLDFSSDAAQVCVLFIKEASSALEVPNANMNDDVAVALAKVSRRSTSALWTTSASRKGWTERIAA